MQRTLEDAIAEIELSENGPKIAAFFDFDGTLIYGYSALVFAQDRIMSRKVGAAEAIRTLRLGIDYARGKAGYDDLIKLAGATWKGNSPAEVEALGQRLFNDHIADRVYPEARALVAAHQRKGHTVAITTSATWFQVAPIAKSLQIPEVVCQHLEVIDNIVTGNMAGASMWGPGKATAARKFADTHDVNFDASFFYADGDEDTALMLEIGNPRPTNPGNHLEATAESNGWPVLKFAARGTPSLDVIARNVTATITAAPIAAVAAAVGFIRRSRSDATSIASQFLPGLMLGLAAVNVEIQGQEYLAEHPNAVVLWNQRSRIDACVLAKILNKDAAIVIDRTLAADPFVGTIGRLFHTVFARNPTDPDPVLAAILHRELSLGRSVAIAHGSLETPNRISALPAAVARLAANAGVPILPIVMFDSERLVTRRPPMVRPGTIHVRVLEPQMVTATSRAGFEATAATVIERMRAATNEL